MGIATYNDKDIEFTGIDDSDIARQGFGRGLCPIGDRLSMYTFFRILFESHRSYNVIVTGIFQIAALRGKYYQPKMLYIIK